MEYYLSQTLPHAYNRNQCSPTGSIHRRPAVSSVVRHGEALNSIFTDPSSRSIWFDWNSQIPKYSNVMHRQSACGSIRHQGVGEDVVMGEKGVSWR